MLKKLTRALFGKATDNNGQAGNSGNKNPPNVPDELKALDLANITVIPRDAHNISRRNISPNALKVLYRLNDAGFQAFLVGGGVRDLLLGGKPKDFDVSTDATPEDIRELFRNSRIIGRRFKIVHIRYGREIIEVTTFRAHHEAENEIGDDVSRRNIRDLDSAHSESGMILRDNVYGSINEDALRRDFTINALYYTTRGFVVLDFADGMRDLKQRVVRIIGDPQTRFREDPVRLLRAIRFSAKLDFDIEPATRKPIDELAPLLASISPARLFDESLKLLANGDAENTYRLLSKFRIGQYLFQSTLDATADPEDASSKLVMLALRNTDNRLQAGKSITPAFLYAALLWPQYQNALRRLGEGRRLTQPILHEAANEVITEQVQRTAIPKRFTSMMREIWDLQQRLNPSSRKRVDVILQHPRFRAAYDFLLLREESGEDLNGLGQWWTDFQAVNGSQQEKMLQELDNKPAGSKRKRRRRPRTKPTDKAKH